MLLFLLNLHKKKYYLNDVNKVFHIKIKNNKKYIYSHIKFAIIKRTNCPTCGLFSFYIVHLGCINKYLNLGYIPIIDLKSFPNIYNCFNISNKNIWEIFFDQPYGFKLEEVLKMSKKLAYFECTSNENRPDPINSYYNKLLIDFWHNFSKKYMPIKSRIINESFNIMKKLFNNSDNVLGVKMRGTDYISLKLKDHPIPPSLNKVFLDIKKMNKKYKYDWIFIATEDDMIKEKFIIKFKNNIKYLNPKYKINYNYKTKEFITLSKNVKCNIDYTKNYLINIIILSKCKDIIAAKGSGTIAIFILNNRIRNSIIYNLGEY